MNLRLTFFMMQLELKIMKLKKKFKELYNILNLTGKN